jgi:hypothetical protein
MGDRKTMVCKWRDNRGHESAYIDAVRVLIEFMREQVQAARVLGCMCEIAYRGVRVLVEAVGVIIEAFRMIFEAVRLFVEAVGVLVKTERGLLEAVSVILRH